MCGRQFPSETEFSATNVPSRTSGKPDGVLILQGRCRELLYRPAEELPADHQRMQTKPFSNHKITETKRI